ncbi:hypothetical protein JW898_01665 [Candidatus Woesearchaeota archaeon]|nr:hypothetical protein [Candidatus Woesearchaeota archaeon]
MECCKKDDFKFEYDLNELKRSKRRDMIFDILIYSCLTIILVWLVLKTVGVINTPEYIKLLPAYLGVLSGWLIAVKFAASLGRLQNEVDWLKRGFIRMDGRQNRMAVALGRIDERLTNVERDISVVKGDVNHPKRRRN